MISLLAASLFFTSPSPQDLPRAEAFLVSDNGVRRLEDRYDARDLWYYRAQIGRWYEDGRMFFLNRLDTLPPALRDAPPVTRVDYVAGTVAANPRKLDQLREMVGMFVGELPDDFDRPRQLPRGYRDVFYCQGTNTTAIVCAFRPEESPSWYLATWMLAPDDDFATKLGEFEKFFLDRRAWEDPRFGIAVSDKVTDRADARHHDSLKGERELLREDVRRGVAAYDGWHCTDSAEFVLVDDLSSRDFVISVTNAMPEWRSRFAAVLPTPLDGTNVLAVARIYSDRNDYLAAAGEDMEWSAAYWSPERRELVACLPQNGGFAELRRTFHHESFHQYLSYATSMISASPWLNEGYAQYFEYDESDELDWGEKLTPGRIDELAELLPGLFNMDYRQFYSGSDALRRLKYRLAHSIAVFIEYGAPKVRFEPFKSLKRDYVDALLRTHDMREATSCAFGSTDKLNHFVNEWKRFWKNR